MTDAGDLRPAVDRNGRSPVQPSQPQTVLAYGVSVVPCVRPHSTAAAIREHMIGKRYDDASHIFVLGDDRRLAGVIDIADLLAADPDRPAAELMKPADRHMVESATDREAAASMAIHNGVSALAICDSGRRLVGAVPATALMSILRDEHLEDLHHLVGIFGKSEAARRALTAPPLRRALFRLPWIVIGLAGSAITTAIMAQFEATLSANIAIAFFVPALVYLADAIGTQTEVVAVRTFSLADIPFIRFFAAEVGTGAIVGLILSLLALPMIWFAFGNIMLGATVALALLFATVAATVIGFLLPWLFDRCGFDPALSSGPIATIFQDALTLIIYLLVAFALLVR